MHDTADIEDYGTNSMRHSENKMTSIAWLTRASSVCVVFVPQATSSKISLDWFPGGFFEGWPVFVFVL